MDEECIQETAKVAEAFRRAAEACSQVERGVSRLQRKASKGADIWEDLALLQEIETAYENWTIAQTQAEAEIVRVSNLCWE